MAWDDTLVTVVRNLINDVNDPQRYDDDRIVQSIITAGLISTQEFYYKLSYTFDFSAGKISPDPTNPNSLEPIAMALFSLKAACILTTNDYQKAVGGGIRVKDGDSEVDTTTAFKGYKDILEIGPCGSYQKLVRERSLKDSMHRGKAIMTPITHEKFLIQGYSFPLFWDSFVIR
jgi:hypothetical protein